MKYVYLIALLISYNTLTSCALKQRPVHTKSTISSSIQQQTIPIEAAQKCPICLDILYDKKQIVSQLACDQKHAYHYACLSTWVTNAQDNNCPTCRAEIQEPLGNVNTITSLKNQLLSEKLDNSHLTTVDYFRKRTIKKNSRQISRLKSQKADLYEQQDALKKRILELEHEVVRQHIEARQVLNQKRHLGEASSRKKNKKQRLSRDIHA